MRKAPWAPTDEYLFATRDAMLALAARPTTYGHQRRAIAAHLKHVRAALLRRGYLA